MKRFFNVLFIIAVVITMIVACAVPNKITMSDDSKDEAVDSTRSVASGSEIMLQGFHWNSCDYDWWNIVAGKANEIGNAGFTMVWLPPVSDAASDEGYLPRQLYDLNSDYGTQSQLVNAINQLHNNDVKAIADIVINHRVGSTSWGDFSNPGYSNNYSAVCYDDEWSPSSGAGDTGSGYSAARDLDHTNWSVQNETKYWMSWLKNTIGFDGWRYDYVKGYNGYYNSIYNNYTNPYFSVGELWPDINDINASAPASDYHRQALMDWINSTQATSTAFDFTTKWQLMMAVSNSQYWRMGSIPGAIGWWPSKSVTFLDNHDTGPSPGGGQDHWVFPSSHLEEGYAYILTHPGTPCVYWPHYFDWGTDMRNKIDAMIDIREAQGITSTSSVSVQAADSSKYAAIIDGKVAVKIGWGSWSPGTGWSVAASGTNWCIWTQSSQGGGTFTLKMTKDVGSGYSIFFTGGLSELTNWGTGKEGTWSTGNVWYTTITNPNASFTWKVRKGYTGSTGNYWESGTNHSVSNPTDGGVSHPTFNGGF